MIDKTQAQWLLFQEVKREHELALRERKYINLTPPDITSHWNDVQNINCVRRTFQGLLPQLQLRQVQLKQQVTAC